MLDQNAAPGAPKPSAGEPRKPFVRPTLEELGGMTVITQQTVVIPP
jgi:hypothetical protein